MTKLRTELEHNPTEAARVGCRTALEVLAAEHPDHEIWTEMLPGRSPLRYVARRRPGSHVSPYVVVTDDFTELVTALRGDDG